MEVEKLLSEETIQEVVESLAARIRKDYKDKNPLLVGCLTGAFVFMSDLIRKLNIPLECDFLKVSSYEERMTAGEARLLLDNTLPVEGRDVIAVDDIVDTGQCITYIIDHLRSKKPKSLKTCILLYKDSPRVTVPRESIDYLGMAIPDVFVVGYGLDCAQKCRWLPYVASVKK